MGLRRGTLCGSIGILPEGVVLQTQECEGQACAQGACFEVLDDQGEVAPGRRLVRLRTDMGVMGWCDLDAAAFVRAISRVPATVGAGNVMGARINLPLGWEHARTVPVAQHPCTPGHAGVGAVVVRGEVRLLIEAVPFPADEQVMALVMRHGRRIDVLLQPVDLAAAPGVHREPCLHLFALVLAPGRGEHEIVIHRRGHRQDGGPAPGTERIGSTVISV